MQKKLMLWLIVRCDMVNYDIIDGCVKGEKNRFKLSLFAIEKVRDLMRVANYFTPENNEYGDSNVILAIMEMSKDKQIYKQLQKQVFHRYNESEIHQEDDASANMAQDLENLDFLDLQEKDEDMNSKSDEISND